MRFDWQDTLAFEDPKDPTLLAWFHTHFLPVISASLISQKSVYYNRKLIMGYTSRSKEEGEK